MANGTHPFLGVIVEGRGEYYAYPSLIADILGGTGAHVPIVNARGIGNILVNLSEHLDDLVGNYHPAHILITLDKNDALQQGDYDSCVQLLQSLSCVVEEWLETRANMQGMAPLPCSISVVVQDPQFEAWWLAGFRSLARLPTFSFDPDEYDWQNVDSEVERPASILRSWAESSLDLKSPRIAKSVFTTISVRDASTRSSSLDKFRREITRCYDSWLECLDR